LLRVRLHHDGAVLLLRCVLRMRLLRRSAVLRLLNIHAGVRETTGGLRIAGGRRRVGRRGDEGGVLRRLLVNVMANRRVMRRQLLLLLLLVLRWRGWSRVVLGYSRGLHHIHALRLRLLHELLMVLVGSRWLLLHPTDVSPSFAGRVVWLLRASAALTSRLATTAVAASAVRHNPAGTQSRRASKCVCCCCTSTGHTSGRGWSCFAAKRVRPGTGASD
jgi:hypothetical protein